MHTSLLGRGGYGPPYMHSGAAANFHDRSSHEGRGGSRLRPRDYAVQRYEEFKEPNPGLLPYIFLRLMLPMHAEMRPLHTVDCL